MILLLGKVPAYTGEENLSVIYEEFLTTSLANAKPFPKFIILIEHSDINLPLGS